MAHQEDEPNIPKEHRLEQLRSDLLGTSAEHLLPLLEAHMQTEHGQAMFEMGQSMVRGETTAIISQNGVGALFASRCEELSCHNCGAVQYKSEAHALREVSRTSPKFKRCGGCRAVHYCNKSCQKQDWHDHKASCGK
jgi:hypothetical protein